MDTLYRHVSYSVTNISAESVFLYKNNSEDKRKMKRKTVSIAIATFLALALTACTGKAADVQTEEQVVATEVSETVAETTTETVVEAEAEADKETEAVEETYVDSEETTADVQIEESAEGEASDEKNGEEEASDEKEEPAVDEASESVDAANEEDTSKTEETMEEETKPAVTIPDWFDATYYAANNPDVVKALGSSVEALYNHYTAHGKAEGRAAYEGDPNAKSQVADVVSEGQSTGSGVSATGKWYDGLPWGEWVDLGTCYIFIGATREPDHPQWCPIQIRNAADTQWIEDILTQRGYDGGVTYSFRPEKELPEICVINGVTGYEDNGYGVMVPTTDIAPWGY